MASQKFKNLVARTKELAEEVTSELLIKTIKVQDDITKQLDNIKKDYSRNRKTYKLLYEEVELLKSKTNKPKYDKIKNPLERKEGGGGGGLLGALFGGLAAAKMFIVPLISKVLSSVISKAGGIGKALLNLMKKGGKSGIRGAASVVARTASALKGSAAVRAAGALGRTGMRAAIGAGTRMGGAVSSRLAIRQVATFIGRGVAASALGAAGMPLLIASAAAAVGYGTYKLGRYLKLSEKLDDFIKKVSGGKFRDINDFILGMVNGTIGKELFVWVKDKIENLFTDSITYLKDKTNDILGKWSPFIDDPLTKSGGAEDKDKPENKEETEKQKTKANDTFRQQMATGSSGPSMQMDMLAGAKNATDKTPLMMQGVDGYNANVSSDNSASGPTGGLAWKAITKGSNTTIRSRFGKRKGTSKVSSNHTGLDIKADIGTAIYAPEGGTVSRGSTERGGIEAYLRGDSGTKYGFAHLSKVTASGKVSAGAEIAKSGNTGKGTTGPHIHLSIRAPGSDVKINPEGYMIPGSGKASSAKAAGGIGDDTHVASGLGHNIEYAKSYSTLKADSYMNTKAAQTSSKAPRARSTSMQNPSQQASSKSGAISGKVGTVKDPRGAMSADIVMASMSPLFV